MIIVNKVYYIDISPIKLFFIKFVMFLLVPFLLAIVATTNIKPICSIGHPTIRIVQGTPFVLDSTTSYDPDSPKPLERYWLIYSTPYDPQPPPFSLVDPNATIITIPSDNLMQGRYVFLLYVSDGQDHVPCLLDVIIEPPQS